MGENPATRSRDGAFAGTGLLARGSAERVAAGARSGGVGVVDREALLLDRVDEVDRGPTEVGDAHAVNNQAEAVVADGLVAVERAVVEEELVAEA